LLKKQICGALPVSMTNNKINTLQQKRKQENMPKSKEEKYPEEQVAEDADKFYRESVGLWPEETLAHLNKQEK
jgi:hypothetical protein